MVLNLILIFRSATATCLSWEEAAWKTWI